MNKNKPKVIVIGLDGATFKNLKPWMEEGLLPNLKSLLDNGVSGKLESTIPPHSGPAWTSFMTGVNPGKHGIFGFTKPFFDNRDYKRELISSKDIGAETILELLSKKMKKIISINLPITYPPFKINGLMIGCGLLTPSVDFNFTYPKDLFKNFGLNKYDYVPDVRMSDYNENEYEKLILDLLDCTRKRKEVVFKLMNSYDWDLCIVVFGETDRIQHRCWHFMDVTHSRYNQDEAKRLAPLIIKFYQNMDSIVGEFRKYIDDNTLLLIVSDHGFGCLEREIALHALLEKNSLLSHKKIAKNKTVSLIDRLINIQIEMRGFLQRNCAIYRMTKKIIKHYRNLLKIKLFKKKLIIDKHKRSTGDVAGTYWRTIDWQKTFAYKGPSENVIALNLRGIQPEGTVDSQNKQLIINQIIDLISRLYDPSHKKHLKSKVYKKEDVYNGPYFPESPDLYFEIEDGRYQFSKQKNSEGLYRDSKKNTGWHKKEGIIICYGKNLKRNFHINYARIIDVAPTILHFLGCKVPEYMDGKVLEQAFVKEFIENNPVGFEKSAQKISKKQNEESVYSKEEEKDIKKHLSSLGYMD